MHSKNHRAITNRERDHMFRVKCLPCVVCEAEGPSQAHHPEQQLHFIVIPLCEPCHTGSKGWHGTRDRWKNAKMNELKAINMTLAALYDTRRAA